MRPPGCRRGGRVSAILRLTTASGSIYEVAGTAVRRVTRSPGSESERVAPEWRRARLSDWRLGRPMVILWGDGTDEHSPIEARGCYNCRVTATTPITASEIISGGAA